MREKGARLSQRPYTDVRERQTPSNRTVYSRIMHAINSLLLQAMRTAKDNRAAKLPGGRAATDRGILHNIQL